MKQIIILSAVFIILLILLGTSSGVLNVNLDIVTLTQHSSAIIVFCMSVIGAVLLDRLLKRGP